MCRAAVGGVQGMALLHPHGQLLAEIVQILWLWCCAA